VIDPQSVDFPGIEQPQNALVGLLENPLVLLPECGQIIDIEEPAVINVKRNACFLISSCS
jgi:hypothetical protein